MTPSKKLLNRVKRLTEALESIASNDYEEHIDHEFWLKEVSHLSCAITLAHDTEIARTALEEE